MANPLTPGTAGEPKAPPEGDFEDGQFPAWVCPPPPAPSSVLDSTTVFDRSAFTPDEFYPPGRVRRPVITEKGPNVTIEPTKTPEEMFEIVDLSVPLEFVTPLVPCPDNAKFEQEFLQNKSIEELLQKVHG
jgi:hypothetical protein